MWIYDPADLSIKEVNASALDLYGYSHEEMCSMSISDLQPEKDIPQLKKHLSDDFISEFNNAGIWKHKKKDGEILFVQVMTNPVSYEGKSYKVVVAQDVTGKMDYQQKYEMLFEHSLDGVMLTDPNGDIFRANKAACEILGMTEEEIISSGRQGLVVKDEKLEKALKRRSATGKFSGELTFIHKTGQKIPVELTTSVFTNYAGEQRTSLIFRDITDRKDTQAALRREKEFIEIALNSLPGVFFVLNEVGETIRWNKRAIELFGLTPEEIDGRPAADFAHDDDKELFQQEISKVFEVGRTNVEIKLSTAGNTTAVYWFVANRFHQNGQTYIAVSGVDVSQKKALEKMIDSLLQEEKSQRKKAEGDRDKLKEMFEKAPSPKCVLEGSELRFVIANDSYREVVGQEDIVGKKLVDVIPEIKKQGYVDILQQVYQTGEPYVGKENPLTISKKKAGAKEEFVFNLLFAPLFDENDEVYAIFVEAVDLSEQLSYQRKLKKSLQEKEVLLAEIHHRVKNNLAIVSSMMELQAMESTDKNLKRSLKTGQQRIQTIALIHEILYQSKNLSYVNLEKNVRQLLSSIQKVYAGSKDIKVRVKSDSIKLNVNQAIPCALIINEIITNAYKHAFRGRESGQITVSLREKDKEIRIVIEDDGVGISDDPSPENSSSLGMTLIKLLKQQLKAELESTGSDGTKYTLTFNRMDVKGIGSSL